MTKFFLHKYLENLPIRWKLYIAVSSLLLLMGISVIWVVERELFSSFHRELKEDGIAIGEMLAANAVTPILTDDRMYLHNMVTNALQSERELKYIYIVSARKEVVAHTFDKGFPSDLLSILNSFELSGQTFHKELSTDKGEIIDETATPILNGNAGYVFVGMSHADMLSSIKELRFHLLFITGILVVFGTLLSIIISRLVIDPITALSKGSERIGAGDLDIRLPVLRNDEIGILTNSFNKMAESLKSSMRERDGTEKALRDSKELYLSLIEGIDLGITFIDKDHNIIIANSAQAKIFGIEPDKDSGRKCFQQYANKDEICRNCPGIIAMNEGRPVVKQADRKRKDGSPITIKTNSFPVRTDTGNIIGFIEVVEDITEELRLHEELQKIEHIESIGHLAAGLAHDFNNLLAAVLGNVELAKTAISTGDQAFKRLNSAEEACEQARILANQLLTFSKGGTPLMARTSISKLLKNCCQFSLSGASQKLILNVPDTIWQVDLDEAQMGQVFQGLLLNAKEASAANGKIFVVGENIEIEGSSDLPLNSGKYVKISIEDEGEGIKEDILPKIFDPYFSTKSMGPTKGTGLGLTICHSIIKKHRGHISVRSKEGVGTTFSIYLPKSQGREKTGFEPPVTPDENSSAKKHRILLLEDDKELAKTTANMLVHLRHKLEITKTGEEAIISYQKAINENRPFDLLILDLTIKGGMGGAETLLKIRETDQKVKAIVTSGYTDDPTVLNFQEYGFACALPKPYTLSELEAAIQQATMSSVGSSS